MSTLRTDVFGWRNAALQPARLEVPTAGHRPWRAGMLGRTIPSSLYHRPSGRTIRIALLCAVICVIGAGDLYLTLEYLKNGGMSEGNPIARYIMSYNCQWLLAGWKVLLTFGACGILLGCRKARCAELGAWLGAAVMVWLATQWHAYAQVAPEATASVMMSEFKPHDWVAMTPPPDVK